MRTAFRRPSGTLPRALATLLGAAALLCLAPAAQAQWKWVSRAGVVQYSDQPPPPDTPNRDILARPTPNSVQQPLPPASGASAGAAAAVRAGMAKAKAQQEQQRKAQEQAHELQAQVQAQQRAQLCEQARQQLQNLDSGRRIRQAGANGQLDYLDSAQIQAQRQQALAAMQSSCY